MATSTKLPLLACALVAVASAQSPNRHPHLAYLCAAGGQRGTVVRILAGGQNLRGVQTVHVSGEGVVGRVIRHGRANPLLPTEVRRELARELGRVVARRMRQQEDGRPDRRGGRTERAPRRDPSAALPDDPLLRDLDSLTFEELQKVRDEFLDPAHRAQTSAQIAEFVELELLIGPDAAPGDRELRLGGARGLSNPRSFQVSAIPEFQELEPNDFATSKQDVLDLPRIVNGRVGYQDVDRFRFRAQRGQTLVIDAQARRLIPYLADAVPGWFQATLSLFDEDGTELLYADDHRFDPDPFLVFEPRRDGIYTLEIRDAVHRGREDFVYRITIGERPYVTWAFPLGGRRGQETIAQVAGPNLPWEHLPLDTHGDGGSVREASWSHAGWTTNAVTFAVDELPSVREAEPNDGIDGAQRLAFPVIVDGRIERAGDVDAYRFEGRAGATVVAEVLARRLGSPLDSTLRLQDASGAVLAWNDDREDPSAGLVTHQADSYLRATLPADGAYVLRLADARGEGSEAHVYRLRISPPRPDVTVLVTPASVNLTPGLHVPLTVHAFRRDGFEGAIDLALVDAPPGLRLSGGRIPAGCDRVRVTIAPPTSTPQTPFALRIEARARVRGRTLTRPVVPAEEMMQAFGPTHLVPAHELLVDVARARRIAPLRLADASPLRVPLGGTARVRIPARGDLPFDRLTFAASDPPPGLSLRQVCVQGRELVVELAAEPGASSAGQQGNVLIEVHATPRARGDRPRPATPQRLVAGYLPAIPFVVVDGGPRRASRSSEPRR